MRVVERYRINRSWGDGRIEALWFALRGRSFDCMYHPGWDDPDGTYQLDEVGDVIRFIVDNNITPETFETLIKQGFPKDGQVGY